MTTDAERDTDARQKIRNDVKSNYFVEAGAGSGKTTVLVDRMVKMVESGIDISKICAITFTKAAAAEFYGRFRKKLTESDEDAAKEALKYIDLCFMGTIDAFCNMLLSEHPAKARIPSNASVISKEELETLCARELSNIRRGLYEKECPGLKDQCERFLSAYWNGRDIFTEIMPRLMETRNARLNVPAPMDQSVEVTYAKRIANIRELLKKINDCAGSVLDVETKNAQKAADALSDGIRHIESNWDENISDVVNVLKKIQDLRVKAGYDVDKLGLFFWEVFDEHYGKNGALDYYKVKKNGDPLLADALNTARYPLALGFMSRCVGPICEALRNEGKLTYADYLLYLRDMLKEDAGKGGALIRHISDRHSYFLVDEFQDTNPVQAEICFYLCAKEPKPDWKECVPRPGSLFIVGDPKQSIYRFRNADVASFIQVRELFRKQAGEVLVLSRNYRSTGKLCRWFNSVFTNLLPVDTEDQSRFEPIPTDEKKDDVNALTGIYRYCVKNKKSFKDSEDPDIVAGIIRGLVGKDRFTIQADKDETRQLRYEDFMVITPGKGHMSYYARRFSEYGIPFMIEGKLEFDKCPALVLVSRVMSAVADRRDGKAGFVLERISGCAVPDDRMKEYVKKAGSLSPAALFSLILDGERAFAKAGSENAEYAYYALELLRQAETDGAISSVREGAEYLDRLIHEETEQERCIQLVRNPERVHLANLHKVKGLEAPVVILVDPKQKTHGPKFRVDYGGKEPQSYVLKLDDSSYVAAAYTKEYGMEEKALDAEKIRLLYVAVTRAKNVLIVGLSKDSKNEFLKSNPWYVLNDYISDDVISIVQRADPPVRVDTAVDAEKLYDQGESASVLNNKAPQDATYHISKPSSLKGISESEGDEEALKAAHETKVEDPALVGSMVHRIMEALVSSKGAADDSDGLVSETLSEFDDGGNDLDQKYRHMLETVVETVMNGGYEQDNGAPKNILGELLSAETVFCELPFCYSEDKKQIWHGVIDVVYRKDGKWHIVDYKTNADPNGLDKKYQEQLKAYKDAFSAKMGEEADALIYHIDLTE